MKIRMWDGHLTAYHIESCKEVFKLLLNSSIDKTDNSA